MKTHIQHGCWMCVFVGYKAAEHSGLVGIPKGATSPFWHTTLLARSSVLCLSTDWREKLYHRLRGDAALSDRKTSRDLRAFSEKITARFREVDGHTTPVSRPSFYF